MATLNEIVYSIWEVIRPEIGDDDSIDKRQIKDDIDKQRALWVRNELNKTRTVHPNLVQDLGCVEVMKVDSAECCDIESGCKILRTVEPIPVPMELHQKELITRVGTIDRIGKPFSYMPYNRAIFASKGGKFNKKTIKAFYQNGYIYFVGEPDNILLHTMKYVHIRGVFENPQEAAKFKNCDNTPCFSGDSEYPMMAWMRAYIEGEIIKKYIPTIKFPSDLNNDNNPRTEPLTENT